MGRMRRTFRELQGLSEDTAKRRDVVDAINRKGLLPEQISAVSSVVESAGLFPDDGFPPGAPTGLAATPYSRALSVSWANPPVEDSVKTTVIRVRKTSDLSLVRTELTNEGSNAVIYNLPVISLTLDAYHIDIYNRISGFSSTITATPDKSVADLITESTTIAAGQFSNLLNDPGLSALTDPAKLAAGVVRSASQAGTINPNLLKFNEAEYENYAVGSLAGSFAFTNNLIAVSAFAGKKWLTHNRLTGATDGYSIPFISFTDRTEGEPGDYIFSSEAKNTGVSPINVSVTVQKASDGSGTGATDINGATVTVPAGASIRPFVKFTRDAAKPFIRFLIYVRSSEGVILWNRHMLQKADTAQTEPGPYRMPTLTAGIVAAQLLAAWDVVAGRAIIADTTISTAKILDLAVSTAKLDNLSATSAKIASMAVDKLSGGTFVGGNIFLSASGVIWAGPGTTLDSSGIKLAVGNSYNISAFSGDNKISSGGDFSALMFYWSDVDPYRGAVLRSDGVNVALKGSVNIHSTVNGNALLASSARIEVLANGDTDVDSGRGRVNVYGNMVLSNLFNASDCVATANSRSLAFHIHSYPFKELPIEERREYLDLENAIRSRPAKGQVSREEFEEVKKLLFANFRMHADDPGMDRHERERLLDSDTEEAREYKIKHNMDDHAELRAEQEAEKESRRETRPHRIEALKPAIGG